MDARLKEKTDLMVNNFQELKNEFKWENYLIRHFGAMVHATKGRRVQAEVLGQIKKFIKSETGWTSYFRGSNEFIFSNLLCFEEDYKSFFHDMAAAYDMLLEEGFKRNTYLPLAAYTIVKEAPKDQWPYKMRRMMEFYRKMKENHFWLTSSDDYVFAAVLSTTDLEVEATTENIERCYKYLNEEGFYKGNDLQTLSHILAIGEEETETKCRKAIKIYNKLKDQKCKLNYNGLATLGVLTLIATDEDAIASEVIQVYDYLYEKDGYGFWKLDKLMRTILASTLVSDFYVDEIKKGVLQVALGNSINTILIAQQQAAVAAACAASAAAASSSGS